MENEGGLVSTINVDGTEAFVPLIKGVQYPDFEPRAVEQPLGNGKQMFTKTMYLSGVRSERNYWSCGELVAEDVILTLEDAYGSCADICVTNSGRKFEIGTEYKVEITEVERERDGA